MAISLRPLAPADYERVVAIANTAHNDPFSVDDFAHFITHCRPEIPVLRLVAELDGAIAGYGEAIMPPWIRQGNAECNIVVDPALRGRSVGRALYEALLPFAIEQGAQRLVTTVQDHKPDYVAWAQRRGFEQKHHIFDSWINPAEFDEGRFPGQVEEVLAKGYRFVHYDAIRTDETDRQLWQFHQGLLMDVPNAEDFAQAPFEDWDRWFLKSPQAWPHGYLLAVAADGSWAGLTAATRNPEEPERCHIAFTGVAKEHRGHGLALALKLAGVRFLKEQGVTRLVTNNHSANQPMLAVNRKMGYQPLPGFYVMMKEL